MYKKVIKRILDFLVALMATPFVLLVVLILAPFIYFCDKGPIFYNAERCGKNGKSFKMFKLRSMYVNAPDLRNDDGSTYSSDNDIRVTPIGKFMRKTSLDELPQVLNVLIGDMSIVGPRPTLPLDETTEMNEDRINRNSVRPGITGYAQAYFRNSIGTSGKFHYDNVYVKNISFVLDLKIILKTVCSVFLRQNIYTN